MPPTTEQLVFILIFMYVVTFLGARMAVRRHPPKVEGMVIGVCAICTVFAAAGAVFGVIGIVLYGLTMAGFAFKKPADES